jgi:hypothetical protein
MNRDTFDTLFIQLYNVPYPIHYITRTQEALDDAYKSLRQFFEISDSEIKPHIHINEYEYEYSWQFRITCVVYDTLLCFDSNDARWFQIRPIYFDDGYMFYAKSIHDADVTVFANEITGIELYPFQQCDEVSLHLLGFDTKLLESMGYFPEDQKLMQIRDLTLTIDEDCTYTLLRDGFPIAGFNNEDTSFQTGDAYTEVFIYNKTDIIIENCGDVSSIVVFRGCFVDGLTQ